MVHASIEASKAVRFCSLVLLLVGLVVLSGNGCPTTPPVNQPLPGRGTIVISPNPTGIQASWLLEREDIREDYWSGTSDEVLEDMRQGRYTISWWTVDGYLIYGADTEVQHLYDDETITFEVTYEPPRMDIFVDTEPDTLYATWTLEGPSVYDASGYGDDRVEDMPPGEYTVSWESIYGYTTPPDSTATHTNVSDLTFLGCTCRSEVGRNARLKTE